MVALYWLFLVYYLVVTLFLRDDYLLRKDRFCTPKLTVHQVDLNGDFAAIVAIPLNANGNPKVAA